MIEADKFFFVIPLGRVSGDDPAVVATSGRRGAPASGIRSERRWSRDPWWSSGRRPLARSSRLSPAGRGRACPPTPIIIVALCLPIWGRQDKFGDEPVRDSRQSKLALGCSFRPGPVDKRRPSHTHENHHGGTGGFFVGRL